MFRENCFENVVSDFFYNLFVNNTTFRKRKKNKKKNESVINLWRILGTKLVLLVDFWNHILKTVFPKHFSCCFLLWTLGCLGTCVDCVTKCVTRKIYPMKVGMSSISIFFLLSFCFSFWAFKNVKHQSVFKKYTKTICFLKSFRQ